MPWRWYPKRCLLQVYTLWGGLYAAFLVGLIPGPLAGIGIVAFVVIATGMEVPGLSELASIEGAKVYQVRTGILGGH